VSPEPRQDILINVHIPEPRLRPKSESLGVKVTPQGLWAALHFLLVTWGFLGIDWKITPYTPHKHPSEDMSLKTALYRLARVSRCWHLQSQALALAFLSQYKIYKGRGKQRAVTVTAAHLFMVQHGQSFHSSQDEILGNFSPQSFHANNEHPGGPQPVRDTLLVDPIVQNNKILGKNGFHSMH
jgi:hypothetical protein